jgi:tellurite resistance protein
VLLGGWYTGQWIYTPVGPGTFHPGYILPTVAGDLVASAAARIGQPDLAYMLLGLGSICWLVLGSIILGRPFSVPHCPRRCCPRWPSRWRRAAVASLAWFALNGGQLDGSRGGSEASGCSWSSRKCGCSRSS